MKKYGNLGMLRRKLGRRLFKHSLGVAGMAYRLATAYGVDEKAAVKAGIWHDYGKAFTPEELREKARAMNLEIDEITRCSPPLLHAPVGAALLEQEVGLKDKRILRAIKYHTTGAAELNSLEKIIYLADAIEVGRKYPGVRSLRRLAMKDAEAALRVVVDNSLQMVLQKGDLLHPDSIAFRNELLMTSRRE